MSQNIPKLRRKYYHILYKISINLDATVILANPNKIHFAIKSPVEFSKQTFYIGMRLLLRLLERILLLQSSPIFIVVRHVNVPSLYFTPQTPSR